MVLAILLLIVVAAPVIQLQSVRSRRGGEGFPLPLVVERARRDFALFLEPWRQRVIKATTTSTIVISIVMGIVSSSGHDCSDQEAVLAGRGAALHR